MKLSNHIEGDLIFETGVDYSGVVSIGGSLDCEGADTSAAFPKLTSIGGTLDCGGADTSVAFPKLTSIGGYLDCEGADTSAAFPKLTSIGGSLYCGGADTSVAFPKLTSIGGTLDCGGADTSAAFPKLTSIGGYLYCGGADTSVAFPKLTSIGGYLYCGGADTSVAFPKLTSIGGTLYCGGADTSAAFPKLKGNTNDPNCPAQAWTAKALFKSFLSTGFIFADNILAQYISHRKSGSAVVWKVVVCGKLETSYVIEKDGVCSHGKTIKEAKASFIFKVSDRDTSKYKSWSLDKTISAAEAIASYRSITGACEFGVKHFCEGKDLERKYTPQEIIDMTAGSYGNQTYRNFFNEQSA